MGLAFNIKQIKYNSANKAKPTKKDGIKVVKRRHIGGASRQYGETSRLSGGHSNNILKNITNKISLNPPQTQNPKYPPYTEEEKELVGKYIHGFKYPRFRLEGIDRIKAKALHARHNHPIE